MQEDGAISRRLISQSISPFTILFIVLFLLGLCICHMPVMNLFDLLNLCYCFSLLCAVNSEDGRSFDLGLRGDIEERGFYTEIFHSMSWVFRGDDASPNNSPRCLSKRPRPVAGKYCYVVYSTCEKWLCCLRNLGNYSYLK